MRMCVFAFGHSRVNVNIACGSKREILCADVRDQVKESDTRAGSA